MTAVGRTYMHLHQRVHIWLRPAMGRDSLEEHECVHIHKNSLQLQNKATTTGHSRNDGFDDHIFDLLPNESGVDTLRAQVLPQRLQGPALNKTSIIRLYYNSETSLNILRPWVACWLNYKTSYLTSAGQTHPEFTSNVSLFLPFMALTSLIVAVTLILRVLLIYTVVCKVHKLVVEGLHRRRVSVLNKKKSENTHLNEQSLKICTF